MANKTYIPAFKAEVGDWSYYICQMKYAEVARSVSFAHELGGNQDLSSLIQRGLSARTEEITKYLLHSSHRFLGSMIVATWGGEPEYISLSMDDPGGMLSGLDREFGVLTLDGTHQFFALDGQHRLKAIKDAIKKDPSLGSEDICVLLVTHHDTPEGRERTQRLFTNINRNAKTTTAAENIALDVDDGFAVLTRRFLMEHDFLSQARRVRIFTKPPDSEGKFTLATKSIPKTDSSAWTSITVLYDLLQNLSFGLDSSMSDRSTRPSDDVLEASYGILRDRVEDLLVSCGGVRQKLEASASARDIRAPKDAEELGHAFMRPVVQLSVTRVVADTVQQGLLNWSDVQARLSGLNWSLGTPPWLAVFNPTNKKMQTSKDDTRLLDDLLRVHLAPTSKSEIKRVRRAFKEQRNATYPVAEEDLANAIQQDEPE